MSLATIVLGVLGGYVALGTVFAIAFVLRGAGKIDHVAQSTPLSTRIIWLPGAVALWPLLALRWMQTRSAS